MKPILRLLLFAALALGATARAAPPLALLNANAPIDAWPTVRVLEDPAGALTLDQARAEVFVEPAVPANNFGPRRGALWLHLPLNQTSDRARWVLEIDYPPLNQIDVALYRDGELLQQARLGNRVPAAERPMRTRSHAMPLDLPQSGRYELYLRVQSGSALVVPVRLNPAEEFVAAESSRLLLQGLIFGLALMLLATSVTNGIGLRDPLFASYALMIVGVSTFFVSFTGLGHQFLWDAQVGALEKVSPWGALLATTGASLFARGALDLPRTRPRIAQLLAVAASLGAGAIALSALGLLDYRQTQVAATVLGPIPVLLAVYESVLRAWRGDRSARWMAVGWGAYTVGALSMAALLRGWLAADFLIQHLFQFSSVIEMFAWMRVLSLRIEAVRTQAERSAAERSVLLSLANTDPLTGLPNRRGLAVALDASLPTARPESALAVYLLDLDGFKAVNDRLGHEAGDELLRQVAQRLRDTLRTHDLVARLGGDEFVVMSQGMAGEAAAQRVGQKMLGAFAAPFDVNGQLCRVGLTIGFALAPHDGQAAGDLLRRADAAMYAGKQGGRNCVRRGQASVGLAAVG